MCGLQLVSDNCGISVALRIQELHDNLTNLIFNVRSTTKFKSSNLLFIDSLLLIALIFL